MPFGKGKVVVLGEAGMFSPQVIRFTDGQQREIKLGMNVAGTMTGSLPSTYFTGCRGCCNSPKQRQPSRDAQQLNRRSAG